VICTRVRLINKLGLHARASSVLAQKAAAFRSTIQLGIEESQLVDCKSIMGLMMLAAGVGTELLLRIEGEDEENAHETICQLIADRFGEEE